MQTSDFETYLGFWKNNKADGLGLIIYPSGTMVYANFSRNEISGVAITDDRITLRIGVFNHMELVGIGFEYEYEKRLWKMSRFHKGLTIEIIKEEREVREGVVPKMISI